MEKNKENAFCDFTKLIEKSWTYARFCGEEKERWNKALQFACDTNIITGSYKQRWNTLQALYRTFLLGIGYTNHTWRQRGE